MPNLNNLISVIQNSQRTLFILCGLPYSGKSYLATILRKDCDLEYVSIDEIFQVHGFDWDTNQMPDVRAWGKIFDESYDQVRHALQSGKNVLYDSTNHTVASRDTLRKVASSVRADTKIIYIQSSIETVWQRWADNQKNPHRPQIQKELVQMTIDTFEAPSCEENVIIINN